MSMPNGEAGLDTPFGDWGIKDNVSELSGRDQPTITDFFSGFLQGNNVLGDASELFFNIILGGFESLGNFLEMLVESITGDLGDLSQLTSFFTEILGWITELFDFITSIFGIFGGSGLEGMTNFFSNFLNLFGLGDILDMSGDTGAFDPTDILSNFINVLLLPLNLLTSLTDFTDLLGGFGGASTTGEAGNFFTNFLSLFNNPTGLLTTPGSFDPTASGTSIIDGFVPGIGLTVDNIVEKLLGFVGGGFSHAESAEALGATADGVTSANGQISALWQAIAAGNVALDDFSRSSTSSLGSNWNQTYSGSGAWVLGTDGNATTWPFSTSADRACLNRYVGTVNDTLGDYQIITLVLSSAPAHNALGDDGSNGVIGRLKNDNSSYVMWRVWGDKTWQLSYFASGSNTVLTSGTLASIPGAGSSIQFWLGDSVAADKRKYRLKINNSDLFMGGWYSEVGTGSLIATANRGFGFYESLEHSGGVFFPPAFSGAVNQWAAQDG